MMQDNLKDVSKSARITRYNKYESILNGDHLTVFGPFDEEMATNYVPLNLSRKASKVMYDGVGGKNPPVYIADDPENQIFVEELAFNSSLDTLIPENALGTSALGDGYLMLDFGEGVLTGTKSIDGIFTPDKQLLDLQLVYVDPRDVTIISSPNNKSKVIAYLIEGQVTENGNEYSRKQIITKNSYEVEYTFESNGQIIVDQNLSFKFIHNYGVFRMQHIPNFKLPGSLYGQSDYVETQEIQKQLNILISQLIIVFKKHGEPKFVCSSKVFDALFFDEEVKKDSSGHQYVMMGSVPVIRIPNFDPSSEPDQKIEALTWDAKEQAVLELIRYLEKKFYLISEMAPQVIGDQDGATQASSGIAIKILSIPTGNKIARLTKRYDVAIKNLFYFAQKMSIDFDINNKMIDANKISIEWKDMYPTDDLQVAQIVQMEKATGILSDKSILRKNYRWTEERIDKELEDKASQDSQVLPFSPDATLNNFNPQDTASR